MYGIIKVRSATVDYSGYTGFVKAYGFSFLTCIYIIASLEQFCDI